MKWDQCSISVASPISFIEYFSGVSVDMPPTPSLLSQENKQHTPNKNKLADKTTIPLDKEKQTLKYVLIIYLFYVWEGAKSQCHLNCSASRVEEMS